MSVAQLYLPFDSGSAANFRLWGEGISLQLTAAGWTKTTDTGQVDWTTNPAVPANGSYVSEIRRPASDPLQTGSTAYFIKIEYGSNGGANFPEIRMSIGVGTNGAGTLTGFTIGPWTLHGSTSAAGVGTIPYECEFSWDNSRLAVMMWRNIYTVNGAAGCFFGIERTKDTSGNDSAEGVSLITVGGTYNAQGGSLMRTLVFGVGPANTLGLLGSAPLALPFIESIWVNNSQSGSDSFNSNVPISPLFPDYGKFGNPQTILAFTKVADIPEGALMTTTLYGVTRTYMGIKGGQCFGKFGGSQASAMLMRFD
jgi:hypothetical protein